MKKLVLILGFLSLSFSASADVCEALTQSQAEKALSLITKGTKLNLTFSNSRSMTVKTVAVKSSIFMDGTQYFGIVVNNEAIDLGHTNIRLNENVSLNIAKLIDCQAESADPSFIAPTYFSKKY